MKLNGKIITSLAAFRCNFCFAELWNKLGIFKRDMSPKYIEYIDDEIVLYKAICSPADFIVKNGVLCDSEGDAVFMFEKLDAGELKVLDKINGDNKVLVAAITRLAHTKITNDILRFFITPVAIEEESNKIVIEGGQKLPLVPKPSGSIKLRSVLVSDNKESKSYAEVGIYKLQPGESMFGVFCGNKLVAACPHEDKNNRFKLIVENGGVLSVYDRSSGELVVFYKDARFFSMVNDDNFAVVDGRTVRTYQNEDLERRIRNKVQKIYNPIMVVCENDNLIVTYEDGSEEYIKL